MGALIINKKAIKRLIEYANANVITVAHMQETLQGKRKPVGDIPEFGIFLPVNYYAVFSIEAQPIGLVRHLSVSLISTNAYPNILAVELLAKEFGFRFNETEKCTTACCVSLLSPY